MNLKAEFDKASKNSSPSGSLSATFYKNIPEHERKAAVKDFKYKLREALAKKLQKVNQYKIPAEDMPINVL